MGGGIIDHCSFLIFWHDPSLKFTDLTQAIDFGRFWDKNSSYHQNHSQFQCSKRSTPQSHDQRSRKRLLPWKQWDFSAGVTLRDEMTWVFAKNSNFECVVTLLRSARPCLWVISANWRNACILNPCRNKTKYMFFEVYQRFSFTTSKSTPQRDNCIPATTTVHVMNWSTYFWKALHSYNRFWDSRNDAEKILSLPCETISIFY